MSGKNKEIEELSERLRNSCEREMALHESLIRYQAEVEKANKRVEEEKEKYAELLERYISMMERVVRIDEQREITD